jgi:hypothetical protein
LISEVRDKLRDLFRSRRSDYLTTFNGPVPDRVLADLAEFCRARETTFHTDDRLHAVLEGRREVWLRINKYLNLTDREIQDLIEKKGAGG